MTVTVEPGGTFAGYAVEAVVGRGGMGIVYRAADVALGRPVALKLIAPEFAGDERFRARFLRESRLAASLDHPNVVPIYAAGEADGQLYIAMRFVEGSDLRTLLGGAPLAPERWVAILEQVADALDTAHRRGLVHRDVKPGNVLVDEAGHAYLTDFGITKQVGAASTDTGRIMGTLDYLAPEQIRGDPVDGRADVYALACVLHECVTGAPPFRRETEPETLWAHMQDEPPPLPEQPALEPVLRKALAKDREERHATCGELVAAAREALGLGTAPTIRGRRVPPGLLRRRRVILAAGLALLAATAAAVSVALVDGGSTEAPPSENGVAAIAAKGDGIASFAETPTAPGNIAVGEGAAWALNTENETVSRLDPKTGKVVDSFDTGRQPTDIAAGAGAVWVGNGGGSTATTRVSRVDPGSTAVTHTVKLPTPPDGGGMSFSAGFPGIAVGAGGVWATTPEGTVARIDPETGRIVASVKIEAKTLAAGKEGVWLVNFDNAVTRIDPRTNRPGQRIEVGSNLLSGVAVGAGSVWATSEEGLLWRIDPGPKPITRTIDVGTGSAYVAFGAGYVWTANWVKGTVSRIDPQTNAVVSTVQVGAPQALAAGEGSAWVSVASGPRGTLPASTCSGIASGGRAPDVLIASDMPLQGADNGPPRAVPAGVRAVLSDRGYRAGRFTVGYQSCDDSTAQTGGFEYRKCAANANAYAGAERLVAVIGPWNSFCAQVEIPILNAAPGGPLALISPSNTHPNLTRGGVLALPPPYGLRGEPGVYYPTGERNFFRLAARGDLAGVALAELSKDLRLQKVYLLYDDALGAAFFTDGFQRAAPRLGLKVAAEERFTKFRNYDGLIRRIARSGADGVVLGGYIGNGADLLKALRARLDRRTAILTGDGFVPIPDVVDTVGRAADGLYVAVPDVPPEATEPTAAGRRVVRALGATAYKGYVVQAAAAAEVVMNAIARSDGTRASVLEELRKLHTKDGIIGSFGFDRYGDMTPAKITVLRIRVGARPRDTLRGGYRGAVLDRVLSVPTGLGD